MSGSGKSPFLHVANGTCTTRIIEAAGVPGVRSLWADPLYEGPVPGGLSDRELLDIRMRFLSEPADHTWPMSGGADPSLDPVDDLREWRATIERHELYDELILWFEHDLFDQLNLIQVLTWIRDHLPVSKRVSLIGIGSFPGRPDFKGLGELTPDELAPLMETRQPVSSSQYELARRTWHAFREPAPTVLDQLRREDTSALPHLAAAITRFLQEYPWTTDGLSRTERRLLQLANGDGVTLRDAFPRMQHGERAYYVTDGSLASIADTLSSSSPALLTLDLSDGPEGDGLRSRVTLTATGRAVLAGELDRVTTCGIDRWLGGVHLQGRTPRWRWDESIQSVVDV